MRTTVAPRVSAAPDVLDWLRGLVSVAFVLLLPLLLISTSLRGLVSDREFLLRGFRDNDVGLVTGLDDRQLERVADAFVAYLQGPPGQLQLDVRVGPRSQPLLNDREVEHMQDVQALIQLFLRLQVVAATVVVVRALLALAVDRSSVPIGREMLWSTGLIVGLVALVGVLSLVDFSELWVRFHQVAFRNDLWQLDPSSDYLIMLFPPPFWFAATVRMATTVALQAAAVLIVGLVLVFGPRLIGRSQAA